MMDFTGHRTFAFWGAFESPQAQRAIHDKDRTAQDTIEKLRRNLAESLMTLCLEQRQLIKDAVSSGGCTVFGAGDDLKLLTYEASLNARILLGRMVTRKAIIPTATKQPRARPEEAAVTWPIESAFAKYIGHLQQDGQLQNVTRPLFIDHKLQYVTFEQCQLQGKVAPTLKSRWSHSPDLKGKWDMWCQVGQILLELHARDLIHGDFCDSQVCITDRGPVLADFESMLYKRFPILLVRGMMGRASVQQRLDDTRYDRFSRPEYYQWGRLANECCYGYPQARISSALAERVESAAFAINMLQHLFGMKLDREFVDRSYRFVDARARHQSYFALHAAHEKKIEEIITAGRRLLLDLRNIDMTSVSFAETLRELQKLAQQLPGDVEGSLK